MTQARRPSPLQRRVLIVLAALDAKRPGPVATRDIERVLEQGGDAPVYGPNLRASCRRMEAAGWLRTLRAPNLQLAVELTEAGRGIAEPLFQAEREAETARQRLTDVRREAAYVIRLDGTTCLQLTDAGGIRRIKEGDPLQVASWYQTCFDAGLPVTVQVNESRD
ncbi:MAG: hypothetical protein E7H99_20045 [Citrobacter freundii]|nr:hypothetical protein [Citrobacter freundii]